MRKVSFNAPVEFNANQASNFGIAPVAAASGFPSSPKTGSFHVKDIGGGVVTFHLYTGNANLGDQGWIEILQLTAAEIKTMYESNPDTEGFSTSLLNKLNGIQTGAQVNLTAAEMKAALYALSDTNNLDDALLAKLNGIAAEAQVNTVDSVAGKTGVVVLDGSDVGLGNVTNDAQIPLSEKGVANGVPTLDGSGTIPLAQLPDAAKRQTKVVADITERDGLSGSELWEGRVVTVLDASADGTVNSGSAGYIVKADLSFEKIYEFESMDLDTSVFFNKNTETTDDITEGTTNLFVTAAQRTKIDAIEQTFTQGEKDKLAAIEAGATATPEATTTEAGKIEIATLEETEAVADSQKAVVPSNLVNNAWIQKETFAGDGIETDFDISHSFDHESIILSAKIKNNTTGALTKIYPGEDYPSGTLINLAVIPAPTTNETLVVSLTGKKPEPVVHTLTLNGAGNNNYIGSGEKTGLGFTHSEGFPFTDIGNWELKVNGVSQGLLSGQNVSHIEHPNSTSSSFAINAIPLGSTVSIIDTVTNQESAGVTVT